MGQTRAVATWPRKCGTCGETYDLKGFLALRSVGVQHDPTGHDLLLRACSCKSTLAQPMIGLPCTGCHLVLAHQPARYIEDLPYCAECVEVMEARGKGGVAR